MEHGMIHLSGTGPKIGGPPSRTDRQFAHVLAGIIPARIGGLHNKPESIASKTHCGDEVSRGRVGYRAATAALS
jgi:hypothetical protein